MIAALAVSAALPYSWLEYCALAHDPTCRLERVTKEDVAWINAVVNVEIVPTDDVGPDRWTAFPADHRGDCDDYAVTKRAALLALGVPARDMRIIGGQVNGAAARHVILEVTIGDDVWVLDNLSPDRIYTATARPYDWRPLLMQVPGQLLWTQPGDEPPPPPAPPPPPPEPAPPPEGPIIYSHPIPDPPDLKRH